MLREKRGTWGQYGWGGGRGTTSESRGADSKRQTAERSGRRQRAWHRSAENNTEIKMLGRDRDRETDLSVAWALKTWLASSHAPSASPSPAPLGFPGSSLFPERAKRLPDAGPCTCCSQPARQGAPLPPPPLPCLRPTAWLTLTHPLHLSFQLSLPGAFPSPRRRACSPLLAFRKRSYTICSATGNTQMQDALFINY